LSTLTAPATALIGNSFAVSSTLSRTSAPAGAIAGATVSFALSGPAPATQTGTTSAAGAASVSFSPSARGVHTVVASYSGDAVLAPATSNAATVTVYQRTSLAFPTVSGIAGAPVTMSATLTTFPGGAAIAGQTVSFDFGGVIAAQSATTNASGVASVSAIFPTAGSFGATVAFLNAAGFFTDHTGALPVVAETATTSLTIAHAATSLSTLTAPATVLIGNSMSVSTTL